MPGLKRLVLALPVLLAAQPPALAPEAEDCRASARSGVHIEPVFLSGIAANAPVAVIDYQLIADEVAQIATQGWQLADELRLPGPDVLVYPAGTPLAPGTVERELMCLPLAPPEGAEGTEAAGPRFYPVGRLACLKDRDGDGRYEQADFYATNYGMHVPRSRLVRSVALAPPARLVADPLGLARSRRHVHRQIKIFPVRDGTARLIVGHAFRDPQRPPLGRFDAVADGARVYRPAPALPTPIDRRQINFTSDGGENRVVNLAEGAEFVVGGLRLRIDRRSSGWTITPLADRFPRWIHFGCGGRSLRIGARSE